MSDAVPIVIECMRQVFLGRGEEPPTITADQPLDESLGLDSLDYAELVVRLAEKTGYDPFAESVPDDLRTVADLAALYDRRDAPQRG